MDRPDSITPVILSGGSGTRLWPVSRAGMAKQLVPLIDGESLLQKTLARVAASPVFGAPMVIGAHPVRFILKEQIAEVSPEASLVVEPCRRDTLAAVLLGAAIAARQAPDQVIAVMPSDHLIDDPEAFAASISEAAVAVSDGGVAVIGVTPTEPSTAYGYIKIGAPLAQHGTTARSVERFLEKPDVDTAAQLVAQGCLWNAGVFCFRPDWLMAETERLEPETRAAVAASVDAIEEDLGFLVPGEQFSAARKVSFDYGVMERTEEAIVVPARFRWSDVGDWRALWEVSEKDDGGVVSKGDVVTRDTRNTLVRAESRLVCTLGVENVAVVETADAVLVSSLDQAQNIRGLVGELDAAGRSEAAEHLRCYRPWGWYQTTDLGDRFRVKRIFVKPGARLSLQRHHHRAEHWVVVRGTAEVTIGTETKTLWENESVYVPIGSVHRLANPGKIPVELIEVQTGSYLEEDDIERISDEFGRA